MFKSTSSKPFTILSNIFKERPMKTGQVSGGTAPSGSVSEKNGNTSSSSRSKKASGKEKLSLDVEQIEVRNKDKEREEHWRSAPSPSSKVGGQSVERSGVMSAPTGTAEMGTAYKSPEKTRQSEKHNRSAAASRDERSDRAEGAAKPTSPPRHAKQADASAAHHVAARDAAASSSSEVSYQKILPGGVLVEAPSKPRSSPTAPATAGKTRSGEGTGKSVAALQAQTSVGMGYASILPLSAVIPPSASSPKSPPAASTDAFAARLQSGTSHEEESSTSITYQTVLPGGELVEPVSRAHSPSKSGKPGKTLSGEGSEKSSASASTSTSRNPAGAAQGSNRPGIIVPSGEPPPYAFASGSGQRPRTHSAGASEAARLSSSKHQTAGHRGAASSAAARTAATATTAKAATTTTATTTAATTATTRTTGTSSRQAVPGSYLSLSPPLKSQAETAPPPLDLGSKKSPKSRTQQHHGSPSTASRTTSTTHSTTDSSWTGGEDSSTISLTTGTFSQLSLGGSASRHGKGKTGAGEALPRSTVASGKSQARRSSLDETSSSSRSSERSSEKALPGMRKAKSYTKPGDSRRDDTSRSGASSGSLSRSANLALTSSSNGEGRGAEESTATKAGGKSISGPQIYRLKDDAAPWHATDRSLLATYDIRKAIEAPDTLDKGRHPDCPLPWTRSFPDRPECDIEQEMWDPETVIEDEQDGMLDDRQRFQAKRLWVIRPIKDELVDAVYQTDRSAFAATLATLHEKAIAYGQEYQMPHPWGLESTLSRVMQEIITDPLASAKTLRWLTTQLAAKVPPEHLPMPWQGALANVFKAAYAEKTPGKYTEQFNALHEHCWRVGGRAANYLAGEMESLVSGLSVREYQERGFTGPSEFHRQAAIASPLCMAMWRKTLSVPQVFMQECTRGGNRQTTAIAVETAQAMLMTGLYGQPQLSQSQFHDYVMLACQHDCVHFVDDLVCLVEVRPNSGIISRHMDVETANARTLEIRTHIEAVAKEFGATKILSYLTHWAHIVPYRVRGDAGPRPAILDTLLGTI